jgi:beta-glucosidase-like glycosyl hydrolase
VKGVLRDTWHYDGVVITDDIHMAGAGSDTPASAVHALASGVDAVMICQPDPSLIRATCRTMEDSLRASQLERDELEQSEARLKRLQEWLRVSAFLAQGRQHLSARGPYLAKLPESLAGTPPVLLKAAAPGAVPASAKVPGGEGEETKPPAAKYEPEAKPEVPVKIKKLDTPGLPSQQPIAVAAPKAEGQKQTKEPPVEMAPLGGVKKQIPQQPEKPPANGKEYKVYGVKEGDTLSKIGRKLEVPISVLQKLNPDIEPDSIKEGQEIRYPAKQNASVRTKRSN